MSITESVTHHINSALDAAEDTVRVPDFTITLEGKDASLKNITQRIMSLTMTDNRGFEADRVTLEIDDAEGGWYFRNAEHDYRWRWDGKVKASLARERLWWTK